jgi:hypothetical protein
MEMMAAAVPRSSRPFFSRRFLLPDAPDAGQHRVRDFCSGDRKRIGGSGPQAADTPREKCCRFDGDASGRRIYAYVENDPVNNIDPYGLVDIPASPPSSIPGGPYTPAPGQRPGSFFGPSQPSGPRTQCQFVPDAANGGPPGASQPYWKTQSPGQRGWNRYDTNGNPITPDQAHPNPLPSNPLSPFIRYGSPAGVFLGTLLHSSPAY